MENKKKNFSFFNMGTGWKKFDSHVFFIFSGTRQKFLEWNMVFLKASICDVLMVE